MARSMLRWSVVLGVCLSSVNAFASERFPLIMREQLKLSADPLCTICHDTLIGGKDSVKTAFGKTAMTKYSLRQLDFEGLKAVLTKMEADGVDSDGDKIGDIAELRAGTDPNDGPGISASEDPRYGLYCSASPQRAPWWPGTIFGAGLAMTWARRARSKTRAGEGETSR